MANYSIVANSVFQPFTYQELAAPLDREELYHERLAEEYDKLSSQADILEVMGTNDRDKKSGAYSKYKAYSDFLRSEADNLYQNGLDVDSRERLTSLRRRYNTDIVPIQNAWKKRETEAAAQQQARLQNPTLMFTRDADKTSIDAYIANPMGGYGVVNGALITQLTGQMAANLTKQVLRGTAKKDIDPYTYEYIKRYGLDENMIRNWRNYPTLRTMFEQVMRANGVTPEALAGSMNMDNIISKATAFAEMGMWNAMGEDRAQQLENYGKRQALQHQYAKRLADYQAGLQNPKGSPTLPGSTIRFNFPDAASAGSSARSAFAKTTADFVAEWLRKNHGPFSQAQMRSFYASLGDRGLKAGMEKGSALAYIAKKDPKAIDRLNQQLIQVAGGNKQLVDMWVGATPKKKSKVAAQRSPLPSVAGSSAAMYLLDKLGVIPEATKTSNEVQTYFDWDDFDKQAHTGYYASVFRPNLDPTQEKNFFKDYLAHNSRDGNFNLYGVKQIHGNGNWDYSDKRISRDKLPKDSSGKIDYDQLHLVETYNNNGDLMAYWDDGEDTQWALIKADDVSKTLGDAWRDTYYPTKQGINSLQSSGIITPQEADISRAQLWNAYNNGIIQNNMGRVKVEDTKPTVR
jgi:hypothetical protein